MDLDIRVPIGLMFTSFGLILAGYGIFSDHGLYQRSLNININLWWGLVMLLFGAFLLALTRRKR